MEPIHIAGALVSALLHAGWNAVVKASARPKDAMTAQMVMAAALCVPILAWTGLPARASLPWIAASTALSLLTVVAMLRAYEVAGFGVVYPVMRALSVLIVVPMSAGLSGESVSRYGLAGVGLVVASLLLLALGNNGPGALPRAAAAWIALAGVGTAASVLCDAQGVRLAGSPLAYGCVASIANAAAMLGRRRQLAATWHGVVAYAVPATPIAMASVASYLLILWVWSGAPIAPAAALRDTSAVFAIIISILWLREPFSRLRLAAIVLAAAAVPLLRFA